MSNQAAEHIEVAGARPWRRAILWLAFLAPFFYSTYWSANYISSLRHDVPSIVFDWEYRIPFLAWTIVPYWSINIFCPLSVFVCRTKAELDIHCRRLVTAQVIAVACFLLFPLRFTFEQPQTHGVPGALFTALTYLDKPFNQAPSLHIAVLVILWWLYADHLPRLGRWALHVWFTLIGVSVLTAFFHHFVDVATGALLGVLCVWMWPHGEPGPLSRIELTTDRRRLALAACWLIGAAMTAAVARQVRGTGLWLLWPAVSLTIVALHHAMLEPGGFQRDAQGRARLALAILLAPYLAGAHLLARVKAGEGRRSSSFSSPSVPQPWAETSAYSTSDPPSQSAV